jgi:hypothetical protein
MEIKILKKNKKTIIGGLPIATTTQDGQTTRQSEEQLLYWSL